ncbi:kynureninase [Auriculariales sp. MPI-PUGE-AT-0066]|nr:kynureninase [Auriculariales sp. MPI-PUGE-AT-0066]
MEPLHKLEELLSSIKESDLRLRSVAARLDALDDLSLYRDEFVLPTHRAVEASLCTERADEPCTYLCGNSLGCMPKRSQALIQEELTVWASQAVDGHFKHPKGRNWMTAADLTHPALAQLVGAQEDEVVCMGTLTANLHLLMNTFYQPTTTRYRILCEDRPFPSDQYAFASQVTMHGFNADDAVVGLAPRAGEYYLRHEDILAKITELGESLALVLFPGVQFYTGQAFKIAEITQAAHDQGAICGWDLAHGVGNVELEVHSWNVDFAVWCSYKYLNAGPGAIAGLFVHQMWEKSHQPRHAGWWGHELATRFHMPKLFKPIPGAQGLQQSNPNVFSIAALLGSLQVFSSAGGMKPIRAKARALTGYLDRLLRQSPYFVEPSKASSYSEDGTPMFTVITPQSVDELGSQLSLLILPSARARDGLMEQIFAQLLARGVVGDERRPDVIRLAPVALYNRFEDCRAAAAALDEAFSAVASDKK